MIIGLISDTHISPKKGKLNEKIFEIFENVDLILHAGDITSQKVLDELSEIAPVTAVLGNNDELDLNKSETINANGKTIVLVHGDKIKDLYEFGLKNNADIVVSGHTHSPNFEKIKKIYLINPGRASKSVAVLKIEKEIEVKFIEI
ncbi:YfcE family phosphodiesterase [uncultured Methanobrevibacter sp.]|uniref:YfcE family phosphodiesterase n=1 Tax=uncultured Methanobrevibacter sp. TaxID=253161 RepID=UPI0025E8D9E7|nr:YfcE family phosphodiesterase [uncultured Methanobrevibacter sp.]